ncbi:MAG: hypothetical protein COB78_05880 [Hyphomicrobiales bacterium]|nr:MAG: hypothetical protein COB78_05880 [Hyphomicrobiales bacterium]
MKTITKANEELDRLQKGHIGVALDGDGAGVKEKKAIFDSTKIGGKIVMLEGGSHNPSLLINYQNHHISVPLSRKDIVGLQEKFMGLLRVGAVQ